MQQQKYTNTSASKTQRNIFIAFFRSGILGFGGGPSTIPLIKKEVVDVYGWLDSEEFATQLAIGNTLPGPIALKIAGSIGYRVGGWVGMLNALLAATLPSAVLMIVLLASIAKYKEVGWVQGMTGAVIPIVGVMMAVLTWEFFIKANKQLRLKVAIPLIIVSIITIEVLHIHPGFVIAALLLVAFILPVREDKA